MTHEEREAVVQRLLGEDLRAVHVQTDRLFGWLLAIQWVVVVVLAMVLSPWTYAGADRSVHPHVWSALALGGLLCVPPMLLIARRPGCWSTRHVVTLAQMSFSALLIHVTGGHIETHFHIFVSLAFVAFYRDRGLLVTASALVIVDHLLRGMLWPESIYGVANPEWWRFLEHAAWVAFEDVVLITGIQRAHGDLRRIAERGAALTEVNVTIEQQVVERTAELAASRERYRNLIESTHAVTWEFLPDEGRSCYIAPQIEALLGYPPERFEDPGFLYSIVHPDDLPRKLAAVARAAADCADYEEEVRYLAPNGRVVHVRSMVRVEATAAGAVFRGVTIDITQQKLLEAELRDAQKLESMGRMAAGVAHEISAPLQYIGNDVEYLGMVASRLVADMRAIDGLDDMSSASRIDRVAGIVRRAKLSTIERRLPDAIASIRGGIRAVERTVGTLRSVIGARPFGGGSVEVDVAQCLAATVASARHLWPEIEVVLDVPAKVGRVVGDADTLAVAMGGLVRNAAEACVAAGQPRPRIVVELREQDEMLEIRFRDEGLGVPDAIRGRIFDPFFTTKGVGHGSGEGLHRIRDIVVYGHGGAIACECSGPAGSTFVVRLPLVDCGVRAA